MERDVTEEEVELAHDRAAADACSRCGRSPVREVLDGDPLCQGCCNDWVRGERP